MSAKAKAKANANANAKAAAANDPIPAAIAQGMNKEFFVTIHEAYKVAHSIPS